MKKILSEIKEVLKAAILGIVFYYAMYLAYVTRQKVGDHMYPKPKCDDYKPNDECLSCFYWSDRCVFLDSDIQMMIAEKEE